jgi:predicted SAM-dependent methyltransferase
MINAINFNKSFRFIVSLMYIGLRFFSQCLKPRLQLLTNRGDIRIIIGSSATAMDGWISTEYPYVDITNENKLGYWFRANSVTSILAEHVLEHLDEKSAKIAIDNLNKILMPKGYIRIAVPDGYHPDPKYIDAVKPGGSGDGADDHKILYTIDSLTLFLERSGFLVKPLEWFDRHGVFHTNPWIPEDGMITRSLKFDERNVNKPLTYTSLILDAVKL